MKPRVTLDKTEAEGLINYKLIDIDKKLDKFLQKREEASETEFLEKADSGKINVSEKEVKKIKELIEERDRLKKLLHEIQ